MSTLSKKNLKGTNEKSSCLSCIKLLDASELRLK